MAKKISIYDGTQWVPIASQTTDLSGYATLAGSNTFTGVNTFSTFTTAFANLTTTGGGTIYSSSILAEQYSTTGNITINPTCDGITYGDVSIGGGPDGGSVTLKTARIMDYNTGYLVSFNVSSLSASRTLTIPNASGTIYVSSGTDVTLSDGGTNASLTASNGGIVYSTASAMAILAGTATAGQMLRSGATGAPTWSTATFPSTATTSGTFLKADGTNWIASTQTLTLSGNTTIGSTTNTVALATTANTSVTLPTAGTLAVEIPGAIIQYAGATAPTGYLLCDGSAVSRTTYATLFGITSTTYGVGDGTTTFNLPDLRTRVAVGKNATGTFATLGGTGGAETVTLTTAQIPLHNHSTPALSGAFTSGNDSVTHTHDTAGVPTAYTTQRTLNAAGTDGAAVTTSASVTSSGRSATHTHSTTVSFAAGTSGDAGTGGSHNNLQPYIVLNYIIKT